MSSIITVDLLDFILSPTPGNPAESTFRSVPLPNRVRELVGLLSRLHGTDDDAASVNAGRATLAAVLLRRDICALGGNESTSGLPPASAVALMGEVAEPLLSLFAKEAGAKNRTRRQIGRCVAELCGSLSSVSEGHGREWTGSVLGRLEPGLAATDVACLRLLSDVAERAPVSLWSAGDTNGFSSLFRGAPAALEQLEASMGALCEVGIAYEKARRFASRRSGNGKAGEAESAMLFAQFDKTCTDVSPNSPPAQLGGLLLPSMLGALIKLSSDARSRDEVEVMSRCMSHLSACSERCPSLLAGEEASLSALLQACMAVAQIGNGQEDENVNFLKLSALDVLATITAVPKVRRSIMKPTSPSPRSVGESLEAKSPLFHFLIHGSGNCSNGGTEQKGVLRLCAELAVSGADDDEQGWAEEPALLCDMESSWEEDRAALHAESLLESFVESLGGASALPIVFGMVDSLLASNSWKGQRAVLSILERCLAAAPVTFVPHVPATVDVALGLIQNPSPRVQYQALQLLGSLCCANSVDENGPASGHRQILVRENYGAQILEAVSRLIGSSCTKVASHACLTVVSYCRGGNGNENCMIPIGKGLIVPFIGGLLDALRSGPLSTDLSNPNAVDEGRLTVLVRGIGASACLADAAGDDFLPHYAVMGGLKACALFGLHSPGQSLSLVPKVKNNHEMAVLRGSAIEAASIVGQAVSGPEGENVSMYVDDASEIMTIATTLLNSGNDEIIPIDQLLAACARIAAVMGPRYVQFMPAILPHILNRASEKLEVSITDDKDADESCSADEDEDGIMGYSVTVPGVGRKRVRINTAQLEEKARAARALYEHARALGKEFGPFVKASIDAFLPLVKCEYSGDVRSTSAQALCQVFKAACLSAEAGESPNDLAGGLLPALSRSLVEQLAKEDDEDDVEDRFAIADALSEVSWDAYEHKSPTGERVAQIGIADAREIVSRLMTLISDCLARRATLLSEMTDYSFDDDQIARCEGRAQNESEYLTHLVDSVGYQLKSLGESFTPIFAESMVAPLERFLTSSDVRARLTAVCLLDDCVEHCGPTAASTYVPALLQAIGEALDDAVTDEANAELKRAAVYGITQVARHAPGSLATGTGLDLLAKTYSIAKEVETVLKGDMEHPTLVEHAVSAVASLALFRNSPLFSSVQDKDAPTHMFLRGLPLEEDPDEARICHQGLCELVESNLIDAKTEYAELIRIAGKILALVEEGESVASEDTCSRLMGVISNIQQSVDGNSIQAAFLALEPDAQQALVTAMQ